MHANAGPTGKMGGTILRATEHAALSFTCGACLVLPPVHPPAGLAFKKGDTEENTRDVRTSSGTFLSRGEDPAGVLAYIEDKIAAVTMVPVG